MIELLEKLNPEIAVCIAAAVLSLMALTGFVKRRLWDSRYPCLRSNSRGGFIPTCFRIIQSTRGQRPLSESALAQIRNTDKSETNESPIIPVAERIGFTAERKTCTSFDELPGLPTPFIASTAADRKHGHCIVVHSVDADWAIVADPRNQRSERWSRKQFEAVWDKTVYIIEAKDDSDDSPARFLFQQVHCFRAEILRGVLVSAMLIVISFSVLATMCQGSTNRTGLLDEWLFVSPFLVSAVMLLSRGILKKYRQKLFSRVEHRVRDSLSEKCIDQFVIPGDQIVRRYGTTRLVGIVRSIVSQAANAVALAVNLTIDCTNVVLLAGLLFLVAPDLMLVAIGGSVIIVVVTQMSNLRTAELAIAKKKASRSLIGGLSVFIKGSADNQRRGSLRSSETRVRRLSRADNKATGEYHQKLAGNHNCVQRTFICLFALALWTALLKDGTGLLVIASLCIVRPLFEHVRRLSESVPKLHELFAAIRFYVSFISETPTIKKR